MYKTYRIRHIGTGENLYSTAALSAEHAYSEYRRMRARKAGVNPDGFTAADPIERARACTRAGVAEDWVDDTGVFLAVEDPTLAK